ncbi:MAG: hypothetical protein ACRD0O_06180 [Acidimicrobiia bacterium]
MTTGPDPRFMAVMIGPRRRRYRGRVVAAAVLAMALAVQLWLVALGVVVAALASARFHHRHTKRLLPALLAGRAVIAQRGPATAVEEWAATWLATLAGGHARHLRRATGLVVDCESDPWRAHVATARLWWLLPICVTMAGLTFAVKDLEESRVLPKLLAAEAANLEVAAGSWGEDETPVLDLILLGR